MWRGTCNRISATSGNSTLHRRHLTSVLPATIKSVPVEKDKPVLDEQTFGRLLEAAYVLQEHNRALQKLERNLEAHSQHLDLKESTAKEHAAKEAAPPEHPLAILPAEPETPRPQNNSSAPTISDAAVAVPKNVAASVAASNAEHVPFDPFPEPLMAAELAHTPGTVSQAAHPADYTITLAQIVETQHQIQARHLELENAMSLVAERVTEIAKAGGAAIGFLDGNNVRYRGVAGSMTLPAGTEVPLDKAISVATIKTGQVIRCADVNPEFLFDPEECRRRGIQALIAVPIFHEGGIAGALELYFATTQAFTEQDVNTCQLMAGLITEALARDEELGWKKSLASERAVMLEALEKLKPNLAALVDMPAEKSAVPRDAALRGTGTNASSKSAAKGAGAGTKNTSSRNASTAAVSSVAVYVCRTCGHKLVGEEQFCGKCGTRRSHDDDGNSQEAAVLQAKTSLWHMQEALKSGGPVAGNGDLAHLDPLLISDPNRPEKPLADSIEEEMPELFAAPELRLVKMSDPEEFESLEFQPRASLAPTAMAPIEIEARPDPFIALHASVDESADAEIFESENLEAKPGAIKIADDEDVPKEMAPATSSTAANWSSATSARQFLEEMAGANRPGALARFWKARRGDIYLAIAVILVATVVRWGIWSNHSVSATGAPGTTTASHRKTAPEPDLSIFDRLLVSLGLAEAPPTPENHGNPDTQVWVDLHTALYYCPGADLYGKTPKGKFASQRDAQLDQFEPAYRKACD